MPPHPIPSPNPSPNPNPNPNPNQASCNAIVVKYYDKEKEPLEKGNLSCWLREAVDAAACERDRLGIPNPNPNSHPYHNPNPNPNQAHLSGIDLTACKVACSEEASCNATAPYP